jgi:hypothetical protein
MNKTAYKKCIAQLQINFVLFHHSSNWLECKRTQLYVKHINSMNLYWKWDLWAIITCDLLERCTFYVVLFITWHDFHALKMFLKSSSKRSHHSLFRCFKNYSNFWNDFNFFNFLKKLTLKEMNVYKLQITSNFVYFKIWSNSDIPFLNKRQIPESLLRRLFQYM